MRYFYSLSLTILLPPDLCGCYINPIKLKVLRSWYWNRSRKAVVLLENKSRPEESPAQTWIIKTSIFKVLTAIFSLKNYSECLIYRHAIIFSLSYLIFSLFFSFSFLFFILPGNEKRSWSRNESNWIRSLFLQILAGKLAREIIFDEQCYIWFWKLPFSNYTKTEENEYRN